MSAWFAGFPVVNSEIVVGKPTDSAASGDYSHAQRIDDLLWFRQHKDKPDELNGAVLDYVGPSIDVGFRLGGLASPRRMTLSLELAWVWAEFLTACDDSPAHIIPLRYDDRHDLKGVSFPYPVFWLDVLHNEDVTAAEDQMRRDSNQPSAAEVTRFCEVFVRRYGSANTLSRPYFANPSDSILHGPSDEHTTARGVLRDAYVEERRLDAERQDPTDKDGTTDDGSAALSRADSALHRLSETLRSLGGSKRES
jgi:hypothetical protein